MNYSDKLKDPRWIRLAEEVKEFYDHRCTGCGAMGDGVELHTHHKRYYKGLEPWQYEIKDLDVLCKDCHELFHKNKERFEDIMSNHILYYSYEADMALKILEYLVNDVMSHEYKRVYDMIVDNFKKYHSNG